MSTVAPSSQEPSSLFLATTGRLHDGNRSRTANSLRNIHWFAFLLPVISMAMAAFGSWAVDSQPRVHDEFSVLLGAETLMLGRLSNPVPPCWEAFQSFHIVSQPSYASKYPLGQSLVTALGWSLFGLPIAGTWIAAALATAATYWMLRCKLSVGWATLGTILIGCNPVLHHQWSTGWIHGWLPLAGAAIVLGALVRLQRFASPLIALILGAGIGLLALTRPYEGLVFVLAATCLFLPLPQSGSWQYKLRHLSVIASFAALPVIASLVVTACHNRAVTGAIWKMPYQLHERTYGVAPLFVFGTPNYENAITNVEISKQFQDYHSGWSMQCFDMRSTWLGWLSGYGVVIMSLLRWLLPVMFGCLLSVTMLRFRLTRRLIVLAGIQIFAATLAVWIYPRYLSIVFPGLTLLGMIALRHHIRRTQYLPQLQWSALLVGAIMLSVLTWRTATAVRGEWAHQRAMIIKKLRELPGKDLVIVEYSPEHNCHDEWVYNQADFLAADVLWARGENGRWHEELKQHYGRERTIWLLRPDEADQPLSILSTNAQGAAQ